MIECLCIGGILDGEKKKVNGTEIVASVLKPSPWQIGSQSPDGISTVEYSRYRIEMFRCNERKWYFAIPDGVSTEDAFQQLFDGYKSCSPES